MCKPPVYTQWRLSLSWLAGPSSTRPLSSKATISRSICPATAAKPRWMKRSGTTWPLRSSRGTTPNTRRIARSSWTGLPNKTAKRTKPSTTSKTQKQPWRFITKLTRQRWQCRRSPSSRTTTSPARSRRMASCSSSAPAPWPLDMPPFASCERTQTQATRTSIYPHGRQTIKDILQPQGVLERDGRHQTTGYRSQGL